MANKKKIAAKSKTKASKYVKLMKAASKELADKNKALVKAEKALATATKNHQELVQEVARLDMLERSLKALVEGTEPPQNVRYTYTYPLWVWSWPNYWTIYNTPNTVPNHTQPQWTFTNTPNLPNGGTFLTNDSAVGGDSQNGTLGTVYDNTVTCTLASNNSSPSGAALGSGSPDAVLTSSVSSWAPQTSYEGDTLVVDLTTHAGLEVLEDYHTEEKVETAADITTELVAKG